MPRRLVLASELTACLPKIRGVVGAASGRLVIVPTAAIGEGWFPDRESHVAPFEAMGFETLVTDLVGLGRDVLDPVLDSAAAVYVCGGNTFFLLEHMRRSGFADSIGRRVEEGLLYIGSSAGAVVASPDIGYADSLDDRSRANLDSDRGLDLVPLSPLPHMDHANMGEAVRRLYAVGNGDGAPFLGLNDDQLLLAEGGSYRVL